MSTSRSSRTCKPTRCPSACWASAPRPAATTTRCRWTPAGGGWTCLLRGAACQTLGSRRRCRRLPSQAPACLLAAANAPRPPPPPLLPPRRTAPERHHHAGRAPGAVPGRGRPPAGALHPRQGHPEAGAGRGHPHWARGAGRGTWGGQRGASWAARGACWVQGAPKAGQSARPPHPWRGRCRARPPRRAPQVVNPLVETEHIREKIVRLADQPLADLAQAKVRRHAQRGGARWAGRLEGRLPGGDMPGLAPQALTP
jgi:hypothetical protein